MLGTDTYLSGREEHNTNLLSVVKRILKIIYENSERKGPSGEKGGKFSRWLV
jgi:hypothetical protein